MFLFDKLDKIMSCFFALEKIVLVLKFFPLILSIEIGDFSDICQLMHL